MRDQYTTSCLSLTNRHNMLLFARIARCHYTILLFLSFQNIFLKKETPTRRLSHLKIQLRIKLQLFALQLFLPFKRDFGKRNRQEMLVPLQNKINKEKLATEKLIIMQTVNQFKLLELCESNFSVSYTSIMRFFSADVPIYLN